MIDMQDATTNIERMIANPEQIRRFILGGRAIFTIAGRNARYTYQVTRKEPTGNYTQPVYFLSLLTGPNNLDDYTYIGIVSDQTGQIQLTRKSSYRADSVPVLAFNWTTTRIWSGRELPAPAAFYHVGRCARCGRALTVPSSIESGFGPECAAKMGGA